MLEKYLLVEKSALPDYFLKVLTARRLLETGECAQVSDAVRAAGISRSTFYKYRDRILEPSRLTVGRKASLMLTLDHRAGMLSKVLSALSARRANILTITQSLPIHDRASIMLSIDLSQLTEPMDALLEALSGIEGVEAAKLLALE